ncbi:MAG: GntR family transcriptional regulator [Limnochordia bacterium]
MEKAPRKLSELVYQTLEKAILDQKFTYGQKLSEVEIGNALGVSVTPVREAFMRLEREGLITWAYHRAPTVRTFTEREIIELCDLREALELLSLRLAVPKIDEVGIRSLVESQKQAEAFLAAGDFSNYLRTNAKFHHILVGIAGSRLLGRTMRSIGNRIFLINRMSAQVVGTPPKAIREHYELIDALAARDLTEAQRLMSVHIRNAKERMVTVYRQQMGQS